MTIATEIITRNFVMKTEISKNKDTKGSKNAKIYDLKYSRMLKLECKKKPRESTRMQVF